MTFFLTPLCRKNSIKLASLCDLGRYGQTAYRSLIALPLVLLVVANITSLDIAAQTPEPDVVRIDTDLVNLSVSVFSRKPKLASVSLQQTDFAIFDNGEPQEISFFAASDAPFDLVLLLDLSGSTSDKIGLIKKSAKRFVDAARPNDRIAILTFTADILLVSKLTPDHVALKKSIDDIEKPVGGTNFWDALRFVLEHVVNQSRVEQRRSAVVVMTDGVDNALPGVYGDGSRTTFDELMEVVRRSDSIVLPIYLDTEKQSNPYSTPRAAYEVARRQLEVLASESGNQVYRARKLKDLEGVYEQVVRDLSTVYSIGYRPLNRKREGAWHSVTVELIAHDQFGVRSRRGYYENRQ